MLPTPKKILLVEDDPLILSGMQSKFEDAQYTVVIARDGVEGLEKFISERPDIILTDVSMPRKTGIELLEDIKTQFPNNKTPRIVLSSSDDLDTVSRAIADNAVAYLIKSEGQLDTIVDFVEKRIAQI
jgi:CheY-like chemotaxis protein